VVVWVRVYFEGVMFDVLVFGRRLSLFEFEVLVYVCDETSSFVCCSVGADGGVVDDFGCFVRAGEFGFLYADNVCFVFLNEVLEFGVFVLDAVNVYLYECE